MTVKDFFKIEKPTTIEVYCDSEGGQWSSNEYVILMPDWSELQFFLEMCRISDTLSMEYYDNDEDGIYREDFETEEEYRFAYDQACFDANGMMTFEFTLNGVVYTGDTRMLRFDELETE